ncbi:hypothetical protein MMC14_005166 [Varicellaria rhodocarpa]|nr:hypothetical protein [Varicellaria rhodocarpa]
MIITYAYIYCSPAENFSDLPSSLSMTLSGKETSNHDFNLGTTSDEDFDIFNSRGAMSGTGASSPFIKDEPEDWNFGSNNFLNNQQGFDMQMNQTFRQGQAGSVDPSELTMQNGNFGQFAFGSQPNMSASFNIGNSGIGDDELLDLDLNDSSKHVHMQGGQNMTSGPGNSYQEHTPHGFFSDQAGAGNQNQSHQIFSNTPDGAPIQSPFIHGNFNYAQFMPMAQQQMFSQVSPHMRPTSGPNAGGQQENSFVGARQRGSVPYAFDRKPSDSRSPMTPKTPALGGLHLGGTPDSGNFNSQPMNANNVGQHRHQKSLSNQWDSTSGSLHSYVDSPMASPGHPANHSQISEILKSGKHASLPAKVETGHHPAPAYQSQEAKRRRRRESHNMVERRRRDNINERIQELSHLVPAHRLEDEKVRKHLANNSPLSPTLAATGMSPPQATSLLAGGGRRATGAGNITMGIPIEEKDKGPNKGDILNGSVGWTRDLMWALHVKLQQEAELADLITSLGGTFPFQETEDEKRMRTELMDAMEKNDPNSFEYTRGPGTGLRVPKHTNVAGEPLHGLNMNQNNMGTLSPQSLSPGVQSGGSGANSGGHGQPQFWTNSHSGRGSLSFKEEDEYGMEMS